MQKTRSDYPVLLTTAEVAEILRCHVNHVYEVLRQARAQGWFPVHKVGRGLKVPRDRFFEWLEGRPIDHPQPVEQPKPQRKQLTLVVRRGRVV